MERILTASQMQQADKFTIDVLGIEQEELVLRAGKSIADLVMKRFLGGRVLVCVGKGNNGKDGLVVADILAKTHGFSVCVFDSENPLIGERRGGGIYSALNADIQNIFVYAIRNIQRHNSFYKSKFK